MRETKLYNRDLSSRPWTSTEDCQALDQITWTGNSS